jgi:ribosomal protein S27AE
VEAGAIFLILALVVVVALFVTRPFFIHPAHLPAEGQPALETPEERQRSTLLAERDRYLTALQELDFDYGLGKVPGEDYQPQRTQLLQGAAGVLRQLDALGGESAGAAAEDRVEQAIAQRRADGQRKLPAAEGDELEQLIASRRKQRQEKSAGFCPRCGRPLQKSDKFCPNCGASVR